MNVKSLFPFLSLEIKNLVISGRLTVNETIFTNTTFEEINVTSNVSAPKFYEDGQDISDKYVPYTGAVKDVNLGGKSFTATDLTYIGDLNGPAFSTVANLATSMNSTFFYINSAAILNLLSPYTTFLTIIRTLGIETPGNVSLNGTLFVNTIETGNGSLNIIGDVDVSGDANIGGNIIASIGAVGAPSIYFGTNSDTGLYYIHPNQIGFATGGNLALKFDSYGVMITDGVSNAPSYSFLNDDDSGLYRIGADNIGLTLGGTKTVDFAVDKTTLANVDVTGNATVDNLFFRNRIILEGDESTYIEFLDFIGISSFQWVVGGLGMMTGQENVAVIDQLTLNPGGENLDIIIEGEDNPDLFRTDASTNRIAIGGGSPQHLLDVRGNISSNDTMFANDVKTDSFLSSDSMGSYTWTDSGYANMEQDTDDAFNVSDDPDFDTNLAGGFTMMFWAKTYGNTGNSQVALSKQTGGGGTGHIYTFNVVTGTFDWNWNLQNSIGGSFTFDGFHVAELGWHHIAGTFNGSHMWVYYDGTLQDDKAFTGTMRDVSNTLNIGQRYDSAGTQNWDGDMDDVMIFNRTLLGSEIQDFVGLGPGASLGDTALDSDDDILVWWNFDTSLTDVIGSHTLVAQNNASRVQGKRAGISGNLKVIGNSVFIGSVVTDGTISAGTGFVADGSVGITTSSLKFCLTGPGGCDPGNTCNAIVVGGLIISCT